MQFFPVALSVIFLVVYAKCTFASVSRLLIGLNKLESFSHFELKFSIVKNAASIRSVLERVRILSSTNSCFSKTF